MFKINEGYMRTENETMVDIVSVWKSDFDDYRSLAIIGKNDEEIGYVIASYDEEKIRELTGNFDNKISKRELENSFAVLITSDFAYYINLPKISECSKLLQIIYNEVCTSESSMCYISEDDWNNYYSDSFSSRDLLNLKKEIKKYKLDDVITIDDNDYKIICYGDLETKFVDDLTKNNLDKEKINMDLIV